VRRRRTTALSLGRNAFPVTAAEGLTSMNAYHGQSSVTSISAAGLGALQRRAQTGRAAAAALADRGNGRVLVLGHRGSPGRHRTENSVAAVTASLLRGADGVEVDVRLTGDGVLVCSHGPVLRDGSGQWVPIAGSSWEDLRRARELDRSGVASLAEVLLAVGRHGPRRVIVEAKPVDDDAVAARTAAALAGVLAAVGRFVDVTVSSFDPALRLRIRRAVRTDAVRTALLGETGTPAHALLRQALEDGHDEIHPSLPDLYAAPHAVGAARALGVGVTCWTVNAQADLRHMADLGIEAVVTDDVAGACATLREHAALTACASVGSAAS
jgi:glycerophosphoryl diester phosphodiesterase